MSDCRYCFGDKTSEHLKYPCGTRIQKFFPKSSNCDGGGWYEATIENHARPEEIPKSQQYKKAKTNMWNFVLYDDGDKETLTNEELTDQAVVKIISMGEYTTTKPSLVSSCDSNQQPAQKKTKKKKAKAPKDSAADTKPRKKARTTSTKKKAIKKEHDAAGSEEDGATPYPVYSVHNPPPRSLCIIEIDDDEKDHEEEKARAPIVSPDTSRSCSPSSTAEKSPDDAAAPTVAIKQEDDPSNAHQAGVEREEQEEGGSDDKSGGSDTTPTNGGYAAVKREDETGGTEGNNSTVRGNSAVDTGTPTAPGGEASADPNNGGGEEQEANGNNNGSNEIVPDAPVSASARILGEVFATVNQDIRVKEEGSATILSEEERRKRQLAFDHWVFMNTDAETKQGRYVFRRTCHKEGTICTILKGAGMDPWPVVKNPPRLFAENIENPFIKPGEFYVAGNEAWNPFGPRFPGDKGLVNSEAFRGNPNQKEFHLFVECADHPHKRHWHGKLAARGRMYCGVYRIPDEDDPIMDIEYAKDTHLALDNKKTIADFYARRYRKDYGNLGPDVEEAIKRHPILAEAKELAGEEWDSCNQEKKDMWTVMAYLIHIEWRMEAAPVQFVRFDEYLYRALVKYGCAVTRGNQRGRVELDAAKLHQFY